MKGGDKFASQTNGAMLDMRHGKQCIVSGEMLFDIDDTFLYDIDEDIQLELTFDVSHSTGFVVSDSGVTHRLCGTYSTFAVFVNVRGATTPRRGSK